MLPADLKRQCDEQIALAGPAAVITLVLPGRWGRKDTRRLWPNGPVGRIVSECQRGLIVQAPAREVLAALASSHVV